MRRDERSRKRSTRASVIADRCDLMQLRSAGQEDPLTWLGSPSDSPEEPNSSDDDEAVREASG